MRYCSILFYTFRFIAKFYNFGLISDDHVFYYLSEFKNKFWDEIFNGEQKDYREIFAEYTICLIEEICHEHQKIRHYKTFYANEITDKAQALCYNGCYLKDFIVGFLGEHRKLMSNDIQAKIWALQVKAMQENMLNIALVGNKIEIREVSEQRTMPLEHKKGEK